MSLSRRLIISYIIIILIALTLAFVTLILISRPLQNRVALTRLVAQGNLAAQQINNQYRRGLSTEQILRQIQNRPNQNNNHFLFVDNQGKILFDTKNNWAGLPIRVPQKDDATSPSGTLRDPTGETNLNFAAVQVGPADKPAGYLLAVSARSPAVPRFITELGSGLIVAGTVALMVSLLASVVIARSIALPLKEISGAAGAVAAGDYTHRLPEKGPPEIKQVAASFNVMAGQVENSQQAMRDFVSNVSHELKTPLTSIQGFSQAIMEGATQDDAAKQRAAGIIYQEASRMGRLVEDLLDLARIDSGQVVMQKTLLDLSQILSSTYNRLLPQAKQKEVTLVKNWKRLPRIVGDGDRLAQVFTNLLDNAVRHTPAGEKVTISSNIVRGLPHPRAMPPGAAQPDATTALSERGDFAEVSISDSGPGIPSEDLARIFERFYQVDKSRKRGKGTGLGLAIIKEIIDAHSGYIRAESIEGVGAKFTVQLPITEADAKTLISIRKQPK